MHNQYTPNAHSILNVLASHPVVKHKLLHHVSLASTNHIQDKATFKASPVVAYTSIDKYVCNIVEGL